MKTQTRLKQLLFAGCIASMAPHPLAAAISDEEFNALKDLVIKQGQRIDQLEKGHNQDQLNLDQTRKVHEQDQHEIQQLKQRLEETQKTASDAQQKAAAASQVQPVHPIPEGGSATHNFMVVGDAEIQFGKTEGQHSAFELADFAPIFLFRARDNILFEAGFDIKLQNGAGNGHDSGSSTSIGLSFAQLDYMLSDYVTVVA